MPDIESVSKPFFQFIMLSPNNRKVAAEAFRTLVLLGCIWFVVNQHLNDDQTKLDLVIAENDKLKVDRKEDKTEIKALILENKELLRERYGRVDTLVQINQKIAAKALEK